MLLWVGGVVVGWWLCWGGGGGCGSSCGSDSRMGGDGGVYGVLLASVVTVVKMMGLNIVMVIMTVAMMVIM